MHSTRGDAALTLTLPSTQANGIYCVSIPGPAGTPTGKRVAELERTWQLLADGQSDARQRDQAIAMHKAAQVQQGAIAALRVRAFPVGGGCRSHECRQRQVCTQCRRG